MRPLDPRLLRRVRPARVALAVDVLFGFLATIALLIQATLFASIVARAFQHRTTDPRAIVAFGAVVIARALLASGFEATGRRAAALVTSELRMALVERRLSVRPRAVDGAEAGEIAPRRWPGVDGAGGVLRALPPAARAGRAGPGRGAGLDGGDRPDLSRDHAGDTAADPVFMALIGRYTESQDPGAMGGADTALEPLPRRRPGPPDAPGVQPWRRRRRIGSRR